MPSSTGPAKALGAIFVVGAILMAFVASGLMLNWPVKVGIGPGLYAVLAGWLVIWFPIAVTAVVDAGRLGRRGDLATLQGVLRFVFVADLISTLVVAGRAGRALQFART